MSDTWFTEREASGTLGVEHREGGWFVSEAGQVGETKLLIDSQIVLDSSEPEGRIQVVVDGFRRGVGNDVNYLSVSPMRDTDGSDTEGDTVGDASSNISSNQEQSRSRTDD